MAALVIPRLCLDAFRACDIFWFIDNEAAASTLDGVTSSESDILFLVQQVLLTFHTLKIRVWFEWIDTEANLVDGLSRAG